jgi:hypothetical protein
MSLKNKIHRELLKENHRKESSLILETKILNNQFSTLKSCDDFESLFETIQSKISNFNQKKFNKEVINESLFNILQSLFGDFDSDFWDTVKVRMGDWVSTKMEVEPWAVDSVKEEIVSTPNEEVPKLFSDNDFIANKVAKGYIKGFQDNIVSSGIESKLGGKTGQVFKKTVMSLMNDERYLANLSGKISSQIGDDLQKINDKMDSKAEQIKSTVIG